MSIEEAIWVCDPVKVALQLFGNTEDNRRLWGWYCKRLGRDEFRDVLYRKWRENEVDGMPRNPAATFQKLLKQTYLQQFGNTKV